MCDYLLQQPKETNTIDIFIGCIAFTVFHSMWLYHREGNTMMDIVNGRLGYFQFFTIADTTTMNIFVQATLCSFMEKEYSLIVNSMGSKAKVRLPGSITYYLLP